MYTKKRDHSFVR